MRSLLPTLLLLLNLPAMAGTQERSTPPEPTAEALALIESYGGASEMGRDRSGNLWVFDRKDERIDLISPRGERLGSRRLQVALAVDADSEWGIAHVSLMSSRRVVEVTRWNGRDDKRIRLPYQAGEIRWIGENRIAVAPLSADHRLSIWAVDTGRLVAKLGEEEPVVFRPGLVLLRSILLRSCPQENQIFSLDGMNGDLEVYSTSGEFLWSGHIAPHSNPRLAQQLEEMDRRAKRDGEAMDISLRRIAGFDVDGDCRLLALEAQDGSSLQILNASKSLTTRKLVSTRAQPSSACPSRMFTRWGNSTIIRYQAPDSGAERCIGIGSMQ